MIIEFCKSNLSRSIQDIVKELLHDREGMELEVVEYACLNHCGLCASEMFVIVEGEMINANTKEQLVQEIKAYKDKKDDLDRQWRELGF